MADEDLLRGFMPLSGVPPIGAPPVGGNDTDFLRGNDSDLLQGFMPLQPKPAEGAPAQFQSSIPAAGRFGITAAVRGLGGLADLAMDPLAPLRRIVSPDLEHIEQSGGFHPGAAAGDALFSATGVPEYQPTTPLGRIGMTAAEGAVGGGPFGIVPSVLSALGGLTGQTTMEATGSPRLATAASLLPGAIGGSLAVRASEHFLPPEQQAATVLSRDITRSADAGGPGIGDIQTALAQGGTGAPKPLSLADVGGANIQGRAGAIANMPGPASQIAETFLRDRDAGAGPRLLGDLSDSFGMGPSAFRTAQDLAAKRAADAAPLYEKALDTPDAVHSERLQQFLDDPILRQGLGQGIEVQRLEALAQNKPFSPNDYSIVPQTGEPGNIPELMGAPSFSPTPNMRTLDAAKRGLDNMLDQYRDPTTGRLNLDQKGRAIDQVRQSYLKELDSLNPDYAAARQAWSGPSQSMDAMRRGGDVFNRQPEQIADNIKNLAPGDQDFFLLGARDALAKRIAQTSAGGNEALRITGNQQVQNQIKALFPNDPQAATSFLGRAQLESQMYRTMNNTLGNSRTFNRAAYAMGNAADAGHGNMGGTLGSALQALTALWMHEPAAALPATMNFAKSVAGKFMQPSPEVATQQARMLFNSDPAQNAAYLQAIQDAGQRSPYSLGGSVIPRLLPPTLIQGEKVR